MPTAKKVVKIKVQKPGERPALMNAPKSLSELIEKLNIDGYVITVNGEGKEPDYAFKSGDVVRIGVPTKNA